MVAYGLLTGSQDPVALRSISVDVVVQGFVADVVSELRYQNEEENPVEVKFVFPMAEEAAVYAFEGLIGGTRIEAQIRKKEKAQEEYEDALIEGREAFLLEREENASDVFTCVLGNLPSDGEATLKLHYVQALAPEPDGAIRFVLPAVLNPRYVPHCSENKSVTTCIPRVPEGQLPYTLSLSATMKSSYGINRIESKCTLDPLRYITEDHTAAQVSLAEGHKFNQDVELLIYYNDVHKPSALVEAGKPGADPGSLMGDPVLLLTLYPSLPAPKPIPNDAGEFIFLLDRSGSMDCNTYSPRSRIQSAKETLLLLLKSLPLGCYFNIYGFGTDYESFYPQSVEYSQQTMSESLERLKKVKANLGGTEILKPLKTIYKLPCQEGHPRQLFVFTDGEVGNTEQVIAEVSRHRSSHRCFTFGIGQGASTSLINGMARAAGGSAEFITEKERMQTKALQSLKKALQPAVTGFSWNWDLPAGLEAVLVGSGPQVIFPGHRCLIYAQIHGQNQSSGSTEGSVVLQYTFQDETLEETMKFSLQVQESDRLPIHRLAAHALLQELEGAAEKDEEKKCLALETSLSSGVVCAQTAFVGVNIERGIPIQEPLLQREVPLEWCYPSKPRLFAKRTKRAAIATEHYSEDDPHAIGFPSSDSESVPKKAESLLLTLISLQNANGSWLLNCGLASILGLAEADIMSKTPAQVAPNVWATVLAILWLHSHAKEQSNEWELLEMKALRWLWATEGLQLAECIKAGNVLLGTSVSLQDFGL
ncbi:von Willebrand factor A domain-containing protein 5A-like isoform X2 [Sceloporus undulatus]|uniref:von Willebrand factor A domain-containing protein 5A-like isoform X2 n=1 Tax=Sceloporus undulatus TaxID=8520 RepID=UPI001C4CC9BC|nr:von Willebrand factor A domain-containing protein 5A-like isoform X2 [Sceloporus undulatus]